jgi:26S proteasome regulatory subunit N8
MSVQALKGLKGRLGEMLAYLQAVLDGKIPVNHEIIAEMQDMFNLSPTSATPFVLPHWC